MKSLEALLKIAAPGAEALRLLSKVEELIKENTYQQELMDLLISKGEARRLGRLTDVKVTTFALQGNKIQALVQGTSGVYQTSITLSPRGHRCSCPDWLQNGPKVGPCKHVLALAVAWQEERLGPQMEALVENLLVTLGS